MRNIKQLLSVVLSDLIEKKYSKSIEEFEFQPTRKEFDGDITLVVFALLRHIKGNPQEIAKELGTHLVNEVKWVKNYNNVKGFLNLEIEDSYYVEQLCSVASTSNFGFKEYDGKSNVVVEYSSPNTNKPLHLGHIRNNLLGYSIAKIVEAGGKKVVKTQIINDRGIHICKSMVAWQLFGNNETPESAATKGDKLVGKYYVLFDKKHKEQINELMNEGMSEEEAKKKAPIFIQAQETLVKWEKEDEEVRALWAKMNDWVYIGFEDTYKNLGVDFDSYYYESETYLLGKKLIEEGLDKNILYRKEDNSVWIDLTEEGLDEKLLLRSDGTSVYMTQDLGTAYQRYKDNPSITGMVYTVGNEQNYHFKVLFLILKKLGYSWADSLFHLSYGMVDLPQGKMKSREGTVVDADDLIDEMSETAKRMAEELGKLDELSEEEKNKLYHTIGLGALKYFILKVDSKKRILFDPESSVDFAGNTGPFIQYTYARIQSILRKAPKKLSEKTNDLVLNEKEREIIKTILSYPSVIELAAEKYNPSLIANYVYNLVKSFNSFYQNTTILGEENEALKNMRIILSEETANVISSGFSLLGIEVPNRM